MLGGAPDTYMGAAIQTARKVIEYGYIGKPIGAYAHMICHDHESWHPDAEFCYKHGGGPMMDMGPYYVTALINLLGGVKKIACMTKASFPTRTIICEPHSGEIITVDVPTYVTGMMEFESGAIGTIFTTFDVYHNDGCKIEIHGTESTLQVPDPNCFGAQSNFSAPKAENIKRFLTALTIRKILAVSALPICPKHSEPAEISVRATSRLCTCSRYLKPLNSAMNLTRLLSSSQNTLPANLWSSIRLKEYSKINLKTART